MGKKDHVNHPILAAGLEENEGIVNKSHKGNTI